MIKLKIKRIRDILIKLSEYFKSGRYEMLDVALEKIIVVIDQKKERSFPELALYFVCCKFVAFHFPEYLLTDLKIDSVDDKFVHLITKQKMKIESVAFDRLDQNEFHDYFMNALDYWSMLLEISKDDILAHHTEFKE